MMGESLFARSLDNLESRSGLLVKLGLNVRTNLGLAGG